jgi:hypothetical protein
MVSPFAPACVRMMDEMQFTSNKAEERLGLRDSNLKRHRIDDESDKSNF